MLVVLADDFSGAAEIGGIGWRYGLSTEVQLQFNAETKADLLIIDADTRSLTNKKAIEKTERLATQLQDFGKTVQLFKKVDSVLRGHIVEEINSLRKHFHYKRVLLVPANPGRGRKIISGHYFVNDIALDQTVFANDPYFPAFTSSIKKIIAGKQSVLPHIHLEQNDTLPATGLITCDVSCKQDIKNYVRQTNEDDLCCGGAECFEAYLENKGYVESEKSKTSEARLSWPAYTLIISGSTVKDQFEKNGINELPTVSLPGRWQGDQFVLEKDREQEWQIETFNLLELHKVVAVAINQEVKRITTATNVFSNYFTRLVDYISQKMGREKIHLAITGGATALDILKNKAHRLNVKKEIAPGIVTMVNEQSQELFTVKPGSYLWPASLIKNFIPNNDE